MNIEEFPPHELFTGIELNFSGVRVMNDSFAPATFTLKLELHPMDASDYNAISDSYVKIKYFVNQVLDGAVFMERGDEWSDMTLIDPDNGYPICANNLVMCPSRPTNLSLAKVIHAKLAALASESVHVGFVQLSSTDAGGLGVTSVGDAAEALPCMDDWVGLFAPTTLEQLSEDMDRSYYSKPWWQRDDASTMDVPLIEDRNVAEPPEFAYSLTTLLGEPEEVDDVPKVVRLEFRPRLIQGGKTD